MRRDLARGIIGNRHNWPPWFWFRRLTAFVSVPITSPQTTRFQSVKNCALLASGVAAEKHLAAIAIGDAQRWGPVFMGGAEGLPSFAASLRAAKLCGDLLGGHRVGTSTGGKGAK